MKPETYDLAGSTGPRHIAIVVSSFPERSETFVVDHVKGMLRKGWRVSVIANCIRSENVDSAFPTPTPRPAILSLPRVGTSSPAELLRYVQHGLKRLRHHACPSSWHARLLAVRAQRLRTVLVRLHPDVVHAHFGPNGVTSAIALRAISTPLIVNFHGYDATAWPLAYGWDLYRHLFNSASLVVHSQFLSGIIAAELGRIPTQVTMGVDLQRFSPARRFGPTWPTPLRLLSIGRLETIKGHDIAIRALAILRATRPDLDAQLKIVGEGSQHRSLLAVAKRLGVAPFVTGPVPATYTDIPGIMNEADILLACSRRGPNGWAESFCRVAAEAMASGLPVIATPCGGLPATVGSGGLIAHEESPPSVVDALMQLLDNSTPAACMAASRRMAASYALDRMIEEYHAVSAAALSATQR